MAKPSKVTPSLRFRFQIHPASNLKHAIAALSDTDFNNRGTGLIEVGHRGLEITARNTKTNTVGYLRLNSTGLINFHCNEPVKNRIINLNYISQKLADAAAADDTITIQNLDGSNDLCFILGIPAVSVFSVELQEINVKLKKFPQITCACEALMLSEHLREMIQPEEVSLDIAEDNLNIFLGNHLWRYYYDKKEGGGRGTRVIAPGQHTTLFRWPDHEALKKASFLTKSLLICLVRDPPNTMMLRFNLAELGDLVFIFTT